MRAVCASACTHMEMSGSTCVFFMCVCGPHMSLCAKEMADSEKCDQF